MADVSQSSPATSVIIVPGKKANKSIHRLRDMLGGPAVCDLHFDNVPRARLKRNHILTFLRLRLAKYITCAIAAHFVALRYDRVVLWFSASGYLLGILNLLRPAHKRPKLIWVSFAPTPKSSGLTGLIRELILKYAIKGNDLLICHARTLVDSLHNRFPEFRDKIVFVPWGIPQRAIDKRLAAAKQPDEGYIFSGGRTNRDFDTVMEALQHLNIPAKLELDNQTKLQSHVSDQIEIYRDLPTNQFFNMMGGSKAVVISLENPSVASGLMVMRDAQLMKKPVVISNTAGMSDYIKDGEDGLLFNHKDPEDLKKKLEKLLNDKELYNHLTEKGFRSAQSFHDGTAFAGDLFRTFSKYGMI